MLVTNSSSILAPFSEINRFASFPDLANPALTKACTIVRPWDTSLCSKVKVGKSSPIPPFSKTSADVLAAAFAASFPCRSFVTSLAKTILASLISEPSSLPRTLHSS